MTTFTPQQKRVLNAIKVFQAEYQEGVPYNILKLDLDIPEEDLNQILEFLEGNNHISHQDGIIILKNDIESDQKGEDVFEAQSEEPLKGTKEDNITDSDAVNEDDNDNVDETGDKPEMGDIGELDLNDQLSEVEQKSMGIIKKLVDDSGNISRTLLEGTLLYGELELSSIQMYNLITSLENKDILKKITLTDGEYYHFTP